MNCNQSSGEAFNNSVTVLTQGIARLLDLNCPRQKVDKYVKHLQMLCFGSPEDKFSKYFGLQLTQNECVDCLLSLREVQDYCLTNLQEGLIISQQLLRQNKLSGIASQFLTSILPELVNNFSIQDVHSILESLWKQKDKLKLPLPLVECMLLERKQVENALIEIYDSENVTWKDYSLRYWVQWGSKSSFAFQTITTILNNILINCNRRLLALKMINEYIQCVLNFCTLESLDFVKLYPLEFQSLVLILKLSPLEVNSDSTYTEFERFLVESFKPLFVSEPSIALMLLSHFNQWVSSFNSSDL